MASDLAAEFGRKIPHKELLKLKGERWKTLSSEDKRVFQQKAEADKARFTKEMEVYRASSDYAAFRDQHGD